MCNKSQQENFDEIKMELDWWWTDEIEYFLCVFLAIRIKYLNYVDLMVFMLICYKCFISNQWSMANDVGLIITYHLNNLYDARISLTWC